jgi:hypothetical protein
MNSLAHKSQALPRREFFVLLVLALIATVSMVWLHPWNVTFNDYATEAKLPLSALLHGHFGSFFQTAPPYGPSLVMRAPFALIASLAHGGARVVYRFSALPCLLALAGLGVWLAARLRVSGAGILAALLALAVCVANPLTYYALAIGHPEEILGAVLCVVAVLAAIRGHANWAGVLLGLAIANKEWAIVAVGPVLVALPTGRWRAALIAGAVAAAMLAPLAIAAATVRGASARITVSDGGTIFYTQQVWWFLGTPGHWVPSMRGQLLYGYRLPPAWLQGRAHLLIAWIGLPLSYLAARRHLPRESALLLLAMLLLLRCMLDPWDLVYYPIPFVVALCTWEVTVKHRAPLGAVAASLAAWGIFEYLPLHLSANQQALSFIIPSVIALVAIAAALYRERSPAGADPAATRTQSVTSSSLVKLLSRRAPSESTTAKSSIRTPSLPGR